MLVRWVIFWVKDPVEFVRESTSTQCSQGAQKTCLDLQLNDTIVKRRTNPGPNRVKGKSLDTGRLAFELGQHDACWLKECFWHFPFVVFVRCKCLGSIESSHECNSNPSYGE